MVENKYIFIVLFVTIVTLLLIAFGQKEEHTLITEKYHNGAHINFTDYETIEVTYGIRMAPKFFPGNKLMYHNYTGQEIKTGYIVCYKSYKSEACHRVISVYEKEIVVRGDNNKNDEIISLDNVTKIVLGIIYS